KPRTKNSSVCRCVVARSSCNGPISQSGQRSCQRSQADFNAIPTTIPLSPRHRCRLADDNRTILVASLAVRAYELHPRDGFDALTLVTRPAAALGPHAVRIQVRAVSLNYRDLGVARGAVKRPPDGPRVVAASDGAGVVSEVGAQVTRVKVGDRVAAI